MSSTPVADHPFRRRRHAAVAAVARGGAQAVHAAARRRDAARQDRARARSRSPASTRSSRSPTATTTSIRRTCTRPWRCRTRRRRSTCSSRSAATRRPRSPSARCSRSRAAGARRVLLVMPADHLIRDQRAFADAVDARGGARADRRAGDVRHHAHASGNRIRLHRMRRYARAAGRRAPAAYRARRFVEKPPLALARDYLAAGTLRLELRHVRVHAPTRSSTRSRATRPACSPPRVPSRRRSRARESPQMLEIDAALFAAVPDISIDYAVMEQAADGRRSRRRARRVRLERRRLVAGGVGRSPTPTTTATAATASASRSTRAARTCMPADRIVATVGVDESRHRRHARCRAGRAPRSPAAREGSRRRAEGARPRRVQAARDRARARGARTRCSRKAPASRSSASRCKPGAALSLQLHHHRSEHWVVVRGDGARHQRRATCSTCAPNESTYIPVETRHRLENPAGEPLVDDRGAVRRLPRRRRHRPLRRPVRAHAGVNQGPANPGHRE